MKSLVTIAMLCGTLLACGGVFDDCIFRFTGGKDVNGDGIIRQGSKINQELFNEMKAGVTNDASQFCEVRGDATGVVFRTEKVVIPCRPCETQEMQVLYFPQRRYMTPKADGTVTTNFAPNSINLSFLKGTSGISSDNYSAIFRLRRDPGYTHNRTVDLAAMGYNYPVGCILRIDGSDTNETRGVNLYTSKASTWRGVGTSGFYFPTNMWVDIAMSVSKGRIRLVLARPDRPVVFSTITTATELDPVTNTAGKIGNWRFGNQSDPSNTLIDYSATENNKKAYFYTTFPFHGSLQQLAYWNRTLSDDEIYEALGAPRPNLVQVGLQNDGSDEFGAGRTAAAQSIDADSPTWRNYTAQLNAGDEWTVSFNVLAEESDLAQIFTLKTTSASADCQMLLKVNGQAIGTRPIRAGREERWFVPAAAINTGANQLTLTRIDAGTTSVAVDTFRLGGSFQAGRKNNSNSELSGEQKAASPFRSSADMGWKHWISPLCTYAGGISSEFVASNQVIRVWVDSEVAARCPAKFSFASSRWNRSGTSATIGTESFCVTVNGADMVTVPVAGHTSGAWYPSSFDIPANTLLPGWNEIRFRAVPTNTNYWLIDFYRFELSCWANGTFLLLR